MSEELEERLKIEDNLKAYKEFVERIKDYLELKTYTYKEDPQELIEEIKYFIKELEDEVI